MTDAARGLADEPVIVIETDDPLVFEGYPPEDDEISIANPGSLIEQGFPSVADLDARVSDLKAFYVKVCDAAAEEGDTVTIRTFDAAGGNVVTKVSENDGSAVFSEAPAGLTGVQSYLVAWGDYDNDGDLDLVLTGEDENSAIVTKLYRNEAAKRNTVPTAPCALGSSVLGSDVILSWNAAFDEETPTPGLSYNLCARPESGTEDVMPGMAGPATGYRRIPALGNAQKRLFWILKGLPSGTYCWSVQAIVTAFAGSLWAPGQTVEVP